MIWEPLVEGVQDLYITMKNMDFSLEDYEAIVHLYNSMAASRLRLQGTSEDEERDSLLRDVACAWLNRPMVPGEDGGERNYERWSR